MLTLLLSFFSHLRTLLLSPRPVCGGYWSHLLHAVERNVVELSKTLAFKMWIELLFRSSSLILKHIMKVLH